MVTPDHHSFCSTMTTRGLVITVVIVVVKVCCKHAHFSDSPIGNVKLESQQDHPYACSLQSSRVLFRAREQPLMELLWCQMTVLRILSLMLSLWKPTVQHDPVLTTGLAPCTTGEPTPCYHSWDIVTVATVTEYEYNCDCDCENNHDRSDCDVCCVTVGVTRALIVTVTSKMWSVTVEIGDCECECDVDCCRCGCGCWLG